MSRQCSIPGCQASLDTPFGLCFEHWKMAVLQDCTRNGDPGSERERVIVAPKPLHPYQTSQIEFRWIPFTSLEQHKTLAAEGWKYLYSTAEMMERWFKVIDL
jgi:hypothetical protein